MTYEEAIEYLKTTTVTPHIHPDNFEKWDEAVCLAIEALQKQAPKKSKKNKSYVRICPKCEAVLTTSFQYCDECGQKIDWSDINDK